MANGGARPGAGRKRGIPNKATIARQERIAETGITPLDYMLNVLRDPTVEYKRRDEMAKAVAPYVHPRLATTEIKGDQDKPIQHKLKIEFVRPGE